VNYGRYEIVKEVGRGSMGVVFQASDPQIDRMVAVKVLHQSRAEDENVTKRFLKEAMVIGRLSHPNIVAIFDVGEEQGAIYIAMELLEGFSLSEVIRAERPDIETVISFGIQIAEALDYAHQKGVVHRDIKPGNIVVQADGKIKINDFGIAHIDDSTATLQTQIGDIMGTPAYMSPEQVLGQAVDGRSDLFSLGAVLYELSTGKKAFGEDRKSLATVFNEIIHITPQEPDQMSPSVPPELSKIIMKALEKDPAKRFQSGNECADALKKIRLHDPEPHTAEVPPPVVTVEKKKSSFGVIAGIVLAVAAAGGGIFYTVQPKEKAPVNQVVSGEQRTPPAVKPVPAPEPLTPAVRGEVRPDQKKDAPPGGVVPAPLPPVIVPPAAQNESVQNKSIPERAASKPLPRFALLKVYTVPKGAEVFVNGTLRGTSPLVLKHGLGVVTVRVTHAGYRDSEKKLTLEKMKDYRVDEKMIPLK
jgi:serine/threonine-protein kinase